MGSVANERRSFAPITWRAQPTPMAAPTTTSDSQCADGEREAQRAFPRDTHGVRPLVDQVVEKRAGDPRWPAVGGRNRIGQR